MQATRARAPDVGALFLAAMAMFAVTAVIGMLNGLDLVAFDHPVLLMHVHAGTLGWITLSVLAACRWLFEDRDAPPLTARESALWPVVQWTAIVSVPVFVLTLWLNDSAIRALAALPVFAATIGLLAWLLMRARSVALDVPRLGMLAAVTTLTVGAFFGTLVTVEVALNNYPLDLGSAGGGHVTAMAFGYLVLVGMAIVEWRLRQVAERLSRWGAVQVGALFVGGLMLAGGAVSGNQVLVSLNLPLQLLAVGIFVARMARPVLATEWLARTPGRFFAAAAVFVVVDIAILMVLIAQLLSGAYGPMTQDIELMAIPVWLIFALDHAIFVGVMSNVIFGLALVLAAARSTLWGWADDVVFWGMNVGLIGFAAGLAVESALLKQVFSPIMGAAIVVGLVALAARLVPVQGGAPTEEVVPGAAAG